MFGSAQTRCGKCEGTVFATQEMEPQGAAHKFIAVQCQQCGTAIGVLDYYNLGTLLKTQAEQIAQLRTDLHEMSGRLGMLAHYVQRTKPTE